MKYCLLMYYADSTDALAKQLNETARKTITRVEQDIAFMDIPVDSWLKENKYHV